MDSHLRKHKTIKDFLKKHAKAIYRDSLQVKSVISLQCSISETFTIGVHKHAKSTSHGSVSRRVTRATSGTRVLQQICMMDTLRLSVLLQKTWPQVKLYVH